MLPSATLGQQVSDGYEPNLKTDCRVALSGFKGTEANYSERLRNVPLVERCSRHREEELLC